MTYIDRYFKAQAGGGWREADHPRDQEGRFTFKDFAIKYSPDQPRDPAGSPTGGQWTSPTTFAPPGALHPDANYSPVTSDSRLVGLFGGIPVSAKLNPNYYVPVVGQLIEDRIVEIINKAEVDELEHGLDIIQNLETGELSWQETGGEYWGEIVLPYVPEGHRRVGILHTHPFAYDESRLSPSEPDRWKMNPMLRHGGVAAIGGSRSTIGGVAHPWAKVWFIHPGMRDLPDPYLMEYEPGKPPRRMG